MAVNMDRLVMTIRVLSSDATELARKQLRIQSRLLSAVRADQACVQPIDAYRCLRLRAYAFCCSFSFTVLMWR